MLTFKDLDKMHGQPPDTVNAKITVQAKPFVSEQVGTAEKIEAPATTAALHGSARKKRNNLVREIMKSPEVVATGSR